VPRGVDLRCKKRKALSGKPKRMKNQRKRVVFTSRDVVINDVTLTSLKTQEWSQIVFCDDFVLVTMVASHLFIGDEIGFFVKDVTPICDEFCVVMDLNSFYDERFWS
jgi:hypothetical protein